MYPEITNNISDEIELESDFDNQENNNNIILCTQKNIHNIFDPEEEAKKTLKKGYNKFHNINYSCPNKMLIRLYFTYLQLRFERISILLEIGSLK